MPVYCTGGGGVLYLIKLKDTPDAYSGNAKKALVVNDAEDAVVFDKEMLPRDGSRILTADWDIGNGRMIKADKIRARDGDGLALYEDGGAGIFVKDGGNVGIGMTSPEVKLDVSKAGDNVSVFKVTASSGVQDDTIAQIRSGASGSGYKLFSIDYGAGYANNALTVRGDGNVGIGTTNPGAKLDVRGRILGELSTDTEGIKLIPDRDDMGGSTDALVGGRNAADNAWLWWIGKNGRVKGGLDYYTGSPVTFNDGLISNGDLDMNNNFIKETALDLGDLDNQEYRGLALRSQTAGESLLFGNLVYHTSDNRWYKTDADTLSKTEGDVGIVVTTGTINENGSFTVLKQGTVRYDSWSGTIGAILYVSQTAGAITSAEPSTTGSFSRKIGYLQATNIVYFSPGDTILENA